MGGYPKSTIGDFTIGEPWGLSPKR